MNIQKSLNWKKYIKKCLFVIASSLLSGYLFILGYSYFFEQDKIAIDKYNFEQLRKVVITLDDTSRNKIAFNNLTEFNRAFDTNIQPIKNCYYMTSYNGNQPYMFGFQFESLLYKFFYFRKYYIYPNYNMPYHQRCYGLGVPGQVMGAKCDYDDGFGSFVEVVTNPCEN